MLRTEFRENFSSARSSDQNRLLQLQRLQHVEHVVCGTLHRVPRGWPIRSAKPPSRDAVHTEPIDEFRGELVVHMRRQVTPEQHYGSADAAPIQDFQMN